MIPNSLAMHHVANLDCGCVKRSGSFVDRPENLDMASGSRDLRFFRGDSLLESRELS